MADIALRAYNREIDSLIAQGFYDQAIAHCRHILQNFPRHVQTYRLLGKAFLESQRYSDAADILQRVLSSIPEDFVSHVGMSMIRQDENNIEDAVWHMERAFEQQPANAAIQDELRKLYARRSGQEPPKVRLTRGALARMYFKGELYQQASAELRAALAEDPTRLDLLALLCESYFNEGKKVEAAESCNQLLQKLPNNLVANRILVAILSERDRRSDSEVYQQRLFSLDPYAAFISPTAPTSEQVPDEAVQLEKLTWEPGFSFSESDNQPEWAASLGMDLSSPEPDEDDTLSWLATEESDQLPAEAEAIVESESAGLDLIPDFMASAGWETASEDESAPTQPEISSDELEPAEIPEWLADLEPGEIEAEPPGIPEPPLPPEDTAGREAPAPGELAEYEDWQEEHASTEIFQPEAYSSEAEELSPEPLPEWLQEPGPDEITEPSEEELPEWLAELGPPHKGRKTEAESHIEPEISEDAELPEWLSDSEPAGVEPGLTALEEKTVIDELPMTSSMLDQDEVSPDQLPELDVDHEPKYRDDDQPETALLTGVDDEPVEATDPTSAAEWLSEFVPADKPSLPETMDALVNMAADDDQSKEQPEPYQDDDSDDTLAWLEELVPDQGVEATIEPSPDESAEQIPEAFPEPGESSDAGIVISGEADPGEDDLPDWMDEDSDLTAEESELFDRDPGFLSEESAGSLSDDLSTQGADLQAWLAELDAEDDETGITQAAIPGMSEEEGGSFDFPGEQKPAKETDIEAGNLPEWLADLQPHQDSHVSSPRDQAEDQRVSDFLDLEEPPVIEGDTAPSRTTLEEKIAVELSETATPADLPDWLLEMDEDDEFPADLTATDQGKSRPEKKLPDMNEPAAQAAVTAEEEAALTPMGEKPADLPGKAEVDIDAAFAWLEGLAARQGADEAQLQSPEERLEAPPDWVQEVAETESPEEDEPADSLSRQEQEPAPEEERIRSSTGLVGDIPEEPVESEELQIEPEFLAENYDTDLPAFLQSETEIQKPQTISDEISKIPPFIEKEGEEEAERFEPETIEPPQPEDEIPAWMRELAADEDEELTKIDAVTDEIATEPEAPDLPGWLADIDQEDKPEIEEWKPPIDQPAPVNINTAGLNRIERLPGMGFIRAASLIAHRDAHGEFSSLDELSEVPGLTPEDIETVKPYLSLTSAPDELPEEELPPLEPETSAKPLPAFADELTEIETGPQMTLVEARNALMASEWEAALSKYQELVSAKELLPEVITDLNKAVYRFPDSIDIWIAIGDAYAGSNQLKQALQAYTRAEELI